MQLISSLITYNIILILKLFFQFVSLHIWTWHTHLHESFREALYNFYIQSKVVYIKK